MRENAKMDSFRETNVKVRGKCTKNRPWVFIRCLLLNMTVQTPSGVLPSYIPYSVKYFRIDRFWVAQTSLELLSHTRGYRFLKKICKCCSVSESRATSSEVSSVNCSAFSTVLQRRWSGRGRKVFKYVILNIEKTANMSNLLYQQLWNCGWCIQVELRIMNSTSTAWYFSNLLGILTDSWSHTLAVRNIVPGEWWVSPSFSLQISHCAYNALAISALLSLLPLFTAHIHMGKWWIEITEIVFKGRQREQRTRPNNTDRY